MELQAGSDPAFLLLGDEDQVGAEVASPRSSRRKEKGSSAHQPAEVWNSSVEPQELDRPSDPGLKAHQSSSGSLLTERSLHQQVLQVLHALQVLVLRLVE